ncbi:uncharacterized protein LOC110428665 [Herrania umbratica]|uniref:Uncharacterized protein LOC110428665 n=1 Tax=Herrania umbratica TaxID=108875 RepID=A0A6J1BKZ1_9ROSI|nr:uncharacterized protein LOC110428665 [Herrania umbratica]
MLRLRCLQRSVTIQDKCRPQSLTAQVNRSPQRSAIKHLREKFSSGAEHPVTAQNDSATPRCLNREVSNNSIQFEKSCTSKPQSEDTHSQKVTSAGHQSTWPVNRLTMNTNEDLHKETKPASDAVPQKTSSEARCTEATTSLEGQSENEMAKEQGSNSQQHPFLDSQEIVETISSLNVYTQNKVAKEQDNHNHQLYLDLQETTETTTSLHSCTENEITEEQDIGDQENLYPGSQETVETATSYNDPDENVITEELEDHYQQYFAQTNYDWFSNISRPRSYWEGLRQAWYQEVLNSTSKDEEIRQLLERYMIFCHHLLFACFYLLSFYVDFFSMEFIIQKIGIIHMHVKPWKMR